MVWSGLGGIRASGVWGSVRGFQVREGGENWADGPCTAPDLGAQRRRRGEPSCGAQGTLRGGRGTAKWQVGGPGRVPRKDLQRNAIASVLSAALCASLTLVQPKPPSGGLTQGPGACHPAFPAQPWSSPRPKELGHPDGVSGWSRKGRAAPRTWEGRSRPG